LRPLWALKYTMGLVHRFSLMKRSNHPVLMKSDKLQRLEEVIRPLGRVLVAYSGGVDSSLLLKVAVDVLGKENVEAVIASSATYPSKEKADAVGFCESIGARYSVIETDEMEDVRFIENTPQRCYICKSHLYDEILKIARQKGSSAVVEGSNVDDLRDYRPGRKAIEEKGIMSPLKEAGLTKAEIRALSLELGLPTHSKPAKACLASRIPYHTRIEREALSRIEQGEAFLETLGFGQVRIRCHGEVARIEVEPGELEKLFQKREAIVEGLSKLGFKYVTADLKGYRTGSLNEVL
jgi:uncharacterized protein